MPVKCLRVKGSEYLEDGLMALSWQEYTCSDLPRHPATLCPGASYMSYNARLRATVFALLALLVPVGAAQSLGGPGLSGPTNDPFSSHRSGTSPFDISASGLTQLNSRMMFTDPDHQTSPLQNPALMVSQLDLKAPKGAKKEFEKGYQFYNRKDYQAAIEHLAKALATYPDYVAAHNALGSSYLGLDRNDEAREQFAKAAVLDPHLPLAFLNLA